MFRPEHLPEIGLPYTNIHIFIFNSQMMPIPTNINIDVTIQTTNDDEAHFSCTIFSCRKLNKFIYFWISYYNTTLVVYMEDENN